ncbi:MAG: hypothetical protein ACR2P0_21025 [Acidimicrobiales bacterium]
MTRKRIPIACTLDARAATDQLSEWTAVRGRAKRVETISDGVRFVLPADIEADVRDLARREEACCAFLDITVDKNGPDLVVSITSPDPDAGPVIALLTGT